MTNEEGWSSARYTPDDAAAYLELMRRLSPDTRTDEASLDWCLQRSPAGPAAVELARETATGRVIGNVATVPVGLLVSGKPVTAGIALTPLIDPEYQGRGLALDLLR